MKTRALLMLGGLALVGAAAAEPLGTAGPAGYDGLPPNRIIAIVRATGFDPMGRPVRNGDLYVLRALDPNDIEYRLVIDARTGRTVSLREIATPGPYQPVPPYGRSGGPVYGRIFAPSEDGYGAPRPPRDVPHVSPQHPRQETATAAPPGRTSAVPPLPRPRPYVMDATGSIPVDAPKAAEPKAPAPQSASAPAASAPLTVPAAQSRPAPEVASGPLTAPARRMEANPQAASAPQPASEPAKDNGGAAMPPIAPLD